MDRFGYTALSGMRSSLAAQTVTANNLANQVTPGFRRDFAGTVAAAVEAQGSHSSRHLNARTPPAVDLREGSIITTGRPLDIAVSSGSFLAVQAEDGSEAYTRRGDLIVAPSGLLVNGEGHPVLGEGGPVTLPAASRVEIGPDGGIAILPAGATPGDELQPIGRLKLVTPPIAAPLTRLPSGLLAAAGGPLATDPAARVTSGQLEGSNVNAASELVNLLEQARRFELQLGLVTTARDLDEAGASLLRLE